MRSGGWGGFDTVPLGQRSRCTVLGSTQTLTAYGVRFHMNPEGVHTNPTGFHANPVEFHTNPVEFHTNRKEFQTDPEGFHTNSVGFHTNRDAAEWWAGWV